MFDTGLVSVSFRPLTPQQVAAAAVDAGLSYIEWGSDVHAPYDDPQKLAEIAAIRLGGKDKAQGKVGHRLPCAVPVIGTEIGDGADLPSALLQQLPSAFFADGVHQRVIAARHAEIHDAVK